MCRTRFMSGAEVREAGQVLVEFALILPLLLLLFFGIIEYSRALFQKSMTINAAREGARFAVVQSEWDIEEITAAATGSITPEKLRVGSMVLVVPHSKPSSGGAVTVTVTTRFSTVLPRLLIPLKNNTTISASSTMRYER